MPRIKPVSKLRDHAREIAEYCHREEEPVFLTTHGKGDLVVMAVEHYERLLGEIDVLSKLGVVQVDEVWDKKSVSHTAMMKELKGRIAQRI